MKQYETRSEYMDAIAPGGLGGTYAGSPIACAAALAVIEVFEEEKLLDRSKAVGERLTAGLREIQKKYPIIGDVRGLGSMIAVYLLVTGITGLSILGIDTFVQDLFYGGALVIAVALSQLVRGREESLT